MNLYLDDDSTNVHLVRLLVRAGHDVITPVQAGRAGAKDTTHLMYAIEQSRVLLTGNHDDFELLHQLVVLAQGHHPGVLVVRKDNDPSRDMQPKAIVRALRNFEAASLPIQDQLIILNHWR